MSETMQQVFKYALATDAGIQELALPRGAQTLTVQMQDGLPFLWALTFGGVEIDVRRFRMVGTGWRLPPEQLRYIATVQDSGLVWHFFEVM